MQTKPSTPWLFLAPNLLIFGVFTFLPIAINFVYAFTGGVELYLKNRPYVGLDNLATLLDCTNHFDPSTCKRDLFWRAVWNTVWYSLFQVTLMVLFSLVTALVLNRKISGRGFWRGVYFYPVLLSPVVVALSGQDKYNPDFAAPPVSPTVPAPANRVKLAKSVDLVQSPVGTTVTYTLTALNSGAVAVNLDDFVDTLPPGPTSASYIAGSSRLNGVAFANPLVSGQTLTWRDPGGQFVVPAGGSLALSFQAFCRAPRGSTRTASSGTSARTSSAALRR